MTTSDERRRWLAALHEQDLEQQRLFQLIAGLANVLDKAQLVETVGDVLKISPVYEGDCVLFDNLAIKFDVDDRVQSVYRVVDGSDAPGRAVLRSLRDDGVA